ncbi:peptidase S8/S53 domain-containing protein [Earliella scabrosa]|nr:peptidase S8/S53 domain-containing protein [Earliella scabrosa]
MFLPAAGLLFLCLVHSVFGRPALERSSKLLVRSELPSVPVGFSSGDRSPDSETPIQLTIALPQRNIEALHRAVLDISDPDSSNYGRHLSKSEVQQLVSPEEESTEAVTGWLERNGITPLSISASGDMLQVEMPVGQANEMLGANYSTYVHDATNTAMLRTLSYSLPERLHDHIAFIYPTTQFIAPVSQAVPIQAFAPQTLTPQTLTPRPRWSTRAEPSSSCAKRTTPKCLQDLYNIPDTPATADGNSIAVSIFGNELADLGDLKDFLARERPDAKNGSFTLVPVDHEPFSGAATPEATLDIQYTVGLATNVPATVVSVGNSKARGITIDRFIAAVEFLLEQDTPPLVLSTSFGFSEPADNEAFAGLARQALCDMYAQLGARGTSVLFASGDSGVAGTFFNNPANCTDREFVPTFPASCPFVTAVGSTEGFSPETAAPFSSGGFSNIFPRPAYQDEAVKGYLEILGDKHASRFNASGRAIPDVSAQGVNYVVKMNGRNKLAVGTSASAPTFASVIAMLNDELLNAGRRPLGFLNPFLYSRGAAALNDVTSGSNPGCGTEGFPAAPGWDPVTGMGTPDYNKLLSAVFGRPVPKSFLGNGAASSAVSFIPYFVPLAVGLLVAI